MSLIWVGTGLLVAVGGMLSFINVMVFILLVFAVAALYLAQSTARHQ